MIDMLSLISSASQDVVGIYDETSFIPLFPNARPIRAQISETSQVMSHPVEDGSTVTDHKVRNPVEITLFVILSQNEYRAIYELIKIAFEQSTLLSVHTKSSVYKSLIISDMPHDESPDIYDTIAVAIKLKEVKFAKYVAGNAEAASGNGEKVDAPKEAKQTTTVSTGKQAPASVPTETAETKSSILYNMVH